MPLTSEEIEALLTKKRKPATDRRPAYLKQLDKPEETEHERIERIRAKYPLRQQAGPVRFYADEVNCASRGCTTRTNVTIQGIRRCPTHALTILNEMLLAKDVLF